MLPGPTAEALFVAGMRHFQGRAMREGLAELESAVRARPDWPPARRALAAALTRGGQAAAAGEEYSRLVGRDVADGLATGRLSADAAAGVAEPEDVFGLALATHLMGRSREADRLYRAYARLVGETTPEASRAYLRLAEMFTERGLDWGDPDAERAKALAVNPAAESMEILPRFPDPALVPGAAPYARPIELDPAAVPPPEPYETLPVLVRWRDPCPAAPAGEQVLGLTTEVVRIHVAADGRPIEVVPSTVPGRGTLPEGVAEAVTEWLFEPARAAGTPADAWILFDIPICGEAAADSAGRANQAGEGDEEP